MNKLNEILLKNYKRIKGALIPLKSGCPKEMLLWHYVKEELKQWEREQIDGHLLTCSECLESLKAIRMLHHAKISPQQVPEHLHKKAGAILQGEMREPGLQKRKSPVILKLSLIWDQLRNKITQLKPELDEILIAQMSEFQPIRKDHETAEKITQSFPYARGIEINEGRFLLKINCSTTVEHLILKTSFQPREGSISREVHNMRAVLCKSGKLCSSVYLDQKGEAVFTRVKEGEYSVELFAGEESLGAVEFAINKVS